MMAEHCCYLSSLNALKSQQQMKPYFDSHLSNYCLFDAEVQKVLHDTKNESYRIILSINVMSRCRANVPWIILAWEADVFDIICLSNGQSGAVVTFAFSGFVTLSE